MVNLHKSWIFNQMTLWRSTLRADSQLEAHYNESPETDVKKSCECSIFHAVVVNPRQHLSIRILSPGRTSFYCLRVLWLVFYNAEFVYTSNYQLSKYDKWDLIFACFIAPPQGYGLHCWPGPVRLQPPHLFLLLHWHMDTLRSWGKVEK